MKTFTVRIYSGLNSHTDIHIPSEKDDKPLKAVTIEPHLKDGSAKLCLTYQGAKTTYLTTSIAYMMIERFELVIPSKVVRGVEIVEL